jgi:cyclic pyranopterin phosphate synthase
MDNQFAKELVGLKSKDILNIISKKYDFEEVERDTSSPAKYFKLKDGYKFGIIEPSNHDFCSTCNRLRLTAEGNLIPCLYFDEAMSIREAIKEKNITKATEILKQVVKDKPEKNRWVDDEISTRAFYETGG